MPQARLRKRSPAWVKRDVFGDHQLTSERSGTAGSLLWANGHSMNRLAVFNRQTGRRTVKQTFAFASASRIELKISGDCASNI